MHDAPALPTWPVTVSTATIEKVSSESRNCIIDKNIKISCNGIPDFDNDKLMFAFKEMFIKDYTLMNDEKKSLDKNISDLIKKTIRSVIKHDFNKKPEVNSHILRL